MSAGVDQLGRAMRAERWAEALDAIRALWLTHRSPALGSLAQLVSARIELTVPALARGKRDAMQREWLAVAAKRQPADLPRLVRALSETHFRSTDALVRAKKLKAFGIDPRTSALLVAQLLNPRFTASSSKPFWLEVFALLRSQADPQAVVLLRDYQRRLSSVLRHSSSQPMRTWFRSQAQTVVDELEGSHPKVLSPSDETLVKQWLDAAKETEAIERQLLEAVYAAPEQNARRLVYADALMARRDPRGEFISLQIANRDREKARLLLEENRAKWLGSLAPVVVLSSFERGFLRAVHLTDDEDALAAVVGDATWSTVTSVATHEWSPRFEQLVTNPVMRSLDTLSAPPALLSARKPLPVTTLRFDGPFDSSPRATRQFVAALAKSRAVERVRHLTVRALPGWPTWVAELPWVKQLETLGLNIDHTVPRSLGAWAEAAAAIRSLKRFRLERDSVEFETEIDFELQRPGGSAKWRTLIIRSAKSWHDVAVDVVCAGVPPGVKKISLELEASLKGPQQKRLDAWLEALGASAPRLTLTSWRKL